MNDYRELIERFRGAVEFHKSERMPCDLAITPETCTKAADAIEQLVRERDEWIIAYDGAQRAYHEWFAEAQKLLKERDALRKELENDKRA